MATNTALLGFGTWASYEVHREFKMIKKQVPDLKYCFDDTDDIYFSKSNPDSIFRVGYDDDQVHQYKLVTKSYHK